MVAWFGESWQPVYAKGLETGLHALGAKDQALFLVGYLIGQLCNGGTFMVYYNPSAEYVVQMAEALDRIGAAKAAQVMRNINSFFPGGSPSSVHEVREQQIAALPEAAWD
jgi:hypothetical protein